MSFSLLRSTWIVAMAVVLAAMGAAMGAATGCSKKSSPTDAADNAASPTESHDGASDATPSAQASPLHKTYTVRGQIVGLPAEGRPFDELQIHHEAIPDFTDRDGNVMGSKNMAGMESMKDMPGMKDMPDMKDMKDTKPMATGMKAMTMPYPVAKGVSLDGLAIGDFIEFTFDVTWGEDYPTYAITKVTKLPADTKLDFGP